MVLAKLIKTTKMLRNALFFYSLRAWCGDRDARRTNSKSCISTLSNPSSRSPAYAVDELRATTTYWEYLEKQLGTPNDHVLGYNSGGPRNKDIVLKMRIRLEKQ